MSDADGSNAVVLADAHRPGAIWAPDASLVAFAVDDEGEVPGVTVQVIEANGSGLRQLATFEGDAAGSAPEALAWSPDGSTIAVQYGFTTIGACSSSIWTIDVDSGARRRITAGSCDYRPTWSPDSTRLAFVRTKAGAGLWTVRVVEASPIPVAVPGDGDANARTVSWAPDGDAVAFDDTRAAWTIGVDGSDLRRIAPELPGMSHQEPMWSPDGTMLALAEVTNDNDGGRTTGGILVVTSEGGVVARLDGDPLVERWLSWSPDQRVIAATVDGHVALVPLDGSAISILDPPSSGGTFAPRL